MTTISSNSSLSDFDLDLYKVCRKLFKNFRKRTEIECFQGHGFLGDLRHFQKEEEST